MTDAIIIILPLYYLVILSLTRGRHELEQYCTNTKCASIQNLQRYKLLHQGIRLCYLQFKVTTYQICSHPSGSMVAASFPTSVLAASPVVTKSRLVQIIILFLHRVSMTFVLRTFSRNPTPLERTREMMMWSASFPVPSVRQIPQLLKKLLALEGVHIEALVFPRKPF
jgi:hypothetical protein